MDLTKINKTSVTRLLLIFIALPLWANMDQNTINSPHLPISHCYHWLDERGSGYLTKKYAFAKANNGSVTFYTTPGTSNGAVAGPGLYCAKTPVGSMGYGDRVIRLDLVDDIVLYDANLGKKHCGHDGKYYPNQSTCDSKPWDIKFYSGGGVGNTAWYVIRDPQAIAQWSGNSAQLESDLLLNKKFSGASYQAHADLTIQYMKAERARIGEMTIINHKARMNLVEILNDPEEMKEIPPLNLIARVLRYTGRDLSDKKKNEVYEEQAIRALEDIYLDYNDIKSAIKGSNKLQSIFTDVALKLTNKADLHKYNVIAAYLMLREYAPAKLGQQVVTKIWSSIFKSDNVFDPLADAKITEAAQITAFFKALPSGSNVSKLKLQSQFIILKLLSQFVDDAGKRDRAMPYVYIIFNNYLTQGIEFFDQAYAAITNPKIDKTSILAGLYSNFESGGFANLDPVHMGTILESHLEGNVASADTQRWKNAISKLSLPLTSEETYKILGKYAQGSLKLPSFFDEVTFLRMLYDRSIREQKSHASPTNTFRMILSGYYDVFLNKIVTGKDDQAKINEQNNAEAFFVNLALSLSDDEKFAYGYAMLQNASYFALNPKYPGSLRYRGHPLARFIESYNQGNANFDQMLEELTAFSLDGSYLHHLLFEGLKRKNTAAKALLDIMLDTLTSDAFDNFRSTQLYTLSNTEKKNWHNYIYNSHIANAGDNRAKSDFCGIADTLNKFSRDLPNAVSPAQLSKLQDLIDEGENNNCF